MSSARRILSIRPVSDTRRRGRAVYPIPQNASVLSAPYGVTAHYPASSTEYAGEVSATSRPFEPHIVRASKSASCSTAVTPSPSCRRENTQLGFYLSAHHLAVADHLSHPLQIPLSPIDPRHGRHHRRSPARSQTDAIVLEPQPFPPIRRASSNAKPLRYHALLLRTAPVTDSRRNAPCRYQTRTHFPLRGVPFLLKAAHLRRTHRRKPTSAFRRVGRITRIHARPFVPQASPTQANRLHLLRRIAPCPWQRDLPLRDVSFSTVDEAETTSSPTLSRHPLFILR